MSGVAAGGGVFVVIGAAGGIGRELCGMLSRGEAGPAAAVAAVSRSDSRAVELGGMPGVEPLIADASDPDAFERAVGGVVERHGRLDGVVCCAGSLLLKPAHLTTTDEWRATMEANLTTAYAAVRAAGRHMREGGSVVLVSSAAGRVGIASHDAIAAAKAGVIGLTLASAASYASRGIRVNAVAPGLTRTPLAQRITDNASAAEASRKMHALGRLGEPGDVARAIVWLLSPASGWVTGQVIGVDGGLGTVLSRG